MKHYFLIASMAAVAVLSSCEKEKKLGFEISNMDTTVSPAADFNKFVSGNWLKNNPVPPTESRWGSFNEIQEKNYALLKDILEKASAKADHEKGSNFQKIGDFYFTAIDSVSLNSGGVKNIKPQMDIINGISDINSMFGAMAKLNKYGVGNFFGYFITADSKQSQKHISYLSQGGLSLPDRDYYLSTQEPYTTWQQKYRKHIVQMLTFLGEENATEKAQKIYNLEYKIAQISMDRVTMRNPDTTYNKMHYSELKALNPDLNWDIYFETLGNVKFDSIVVRQPYFFTAIKPIMDSVSTDTWKDFLKWKLINSVSNYLSDEISKASFDFYSATLSGTKQQKPRWKRAVQQTDASLGEILGQEYVKIAFSEEAKKQVHEMVDMLQEAYKERIKNLEWMSDETKEKALHKLSSFSRKLGYPDKWKDYSALSIERDSYVQNIFRAKEWGYNEMLSKLNKPVDKTEWGMSPPTVNAYYSPSKNEIAFPAGIMQAPFFDAEADAAVNFGGIGAVIGHELSHGFDDQGSKYDAEGNLKNWWTDEDKKRFEERTTMLGKQFDNYKVLDSISVNGKLTMGENIADLGGITMAYYAYQKYLEKYGRKDINGFTPEQRFFIGWAQVWRSNFTEQELLKRIKTDPHSPGMFRANGPISNMVEFYNAWNVKEGDAMWRPENERVMIW